MEKQIKETQGGLQWIAAQRLPDPLCLLWFLLFLELFVCLGCNTGRAYFHTDVVWDRLQLLSLLRWVSPDICCVCGARWSWLCHASGVVQYSSQASSWQGLPDVSWEPLAADALGKASGWQQSKENWALRAVAET